MEFVEKYREMGAWAALGAVALALISGFTRMSAISEGYPSEMGPSFGFRANYAADSFAPVTALLVLALLVGVCVYWRQPSRNARLLTLAGLAASGLSALLYFVMRLIGMGDDSLKAMGTFTNILALLATMLILAAIVGFFWVAMQHLAQHGPQQANHSALAPAPMSSASMPSAVEAHQQPTWQPDQAAGGAWHRAGDAATGATAATWGTPGSQNQGWQPSASMQPSAAPQPSAADPAGWNNAPAWGQPQNAPQNQQAPWQQPQQGAWGQPSAADSDTVLRPWGESGQQR